MEGEAKVRGSRCRRRERAARMQKQAMRGGQSADEADESPGRSASKPPRPPNRKKRNKEPIFEEDVIDGFAILSFRTYEDLEVSRPNLLASLCRAGLSRLPRQPLGLGPRELGQPLRKGAPGLARRARPKSMHPDAVRYTKTRSVHDVREVR